LCRVATVLTPVSFPAILPLWFVRFVDVCGNTVVLKPSEKTPMTMGRVFELMEAAGFPPGVVNLVHGGKTGVDALIDHPDVPAIFFFGATPVARHIYCPPPAPRERAPLSVAA